LYKQVAESILKDLRDGKYEPGQKLPSEAVLVRRFNTSRITIGRALRELKQTGYLTGVPGSGNFINAPPADNLLFGLLIPNLGETEIFEPICQGMASAPEAHTYALIWGHVDATKALEEQALQLCSQYIERRLSGVFFAPLEFTPNKDAVNKQICSRFDDARIPVILLDRCILPFPHRSHYDLVGIDNRRAGYLATEHLLSLGHRDVAFLALADAAPTIDARIAGYREALLANGVPISPDCIQRLPEISESTVAAAMKTSGCRSFVCASDRVAGLLLQALQPLNMRVPQDVRVVGIDDVEYASLLSVPLTTIRQPCRAIGEAAITAMLTRREHPSMLPREILLGCDLVVRKSSGASGL
jgi:GntR family transcriptional regulator, arabinose operon transcriptional repressor